MNNTPIKRNKSLVNLSKEHHFGLLACWKIRRGFELKVEPKRIANFVNNFWATHLEAHFIAEEKTLFNVIKHTLVDQALEQHLKLTTLINLISKNANTVQLTEFANLLEQHIRFEERQVFKMLQQELSEEKLDEIGTQLNQLHEEHFEDNYKDEFWLIKE